MTGTPDPSELSAPRDPAAYGRTRSGPGPWAFAAFGVICVLAGAAIAVIGLNRFQVVPPIAPPAAEVQLQANAVSPRPAIETEAGATGSPVEAGGSTPEIATLSERVTAVEAEHRRTARAAASALAAAALMEAAQTSRPFAGELSALEAVNSDSQELSGLRRLAETGTPSRTALAAGFPDAATRAGAASRAPEEGDGLMARVAYALARVVTVRRVGDVAGGGVDAVLARAERQVEDGDIVQALKTLEALPPASREAMAAWRDRAERRAEIDRRVSAIRAQALQDLTELARGGA
jgi:hypothetical protein